MRRHSYRNPMVRILKTLSALNPGFKKKNRITRTQMDFFGVIGIVQNRRRDSWCVSSIIYVDPSRGWCHSISFLLFIRR